LHGEQVRDELANQLVAADLLGSNLLSRAERADRLGHLAALSVRTGNVEEHPRAPFG
jgi:hypothetical protein